MPRRGERERERGTWAVFDSREQEDEETVERIL